MLARRYEYDGISLLDMSPLQIQMKDQVSQKIREGIYQFELVPCCVCRSTAFEPLAGQDRYGLYTPVVICRNCGLIQTNPRMSKESYDQFYIDEYHKLTEGTAAPSAEFFQSQYRRGRKIFTYLAKHRVLPRDIQGLFVLEVGCGAGGILEYFRELGCSVKGVDLDEEYVTFGRTDFNLNLSVATIANAEIGTPADLVIYAHTLEHILRPMEELNEVSRRLAHGGLLYVEVPGVKNLARDYQNDFLRMLQNAHTYHFSLTSLTNLLRLSGFALVVGDES